MFHKHRLARQSRILFSLTAVRYWGEAAYATKSCYAVKLVKTNLKPNVVHTHGEFTPFHGIRYDSKILWLIRRHSTLGYISPEQFEQAA